MQCQGAFNLNCSTVVFVFDSHNQSPLLTMNLQSAFICSLVVLLFMSMYAKEGEHVNEDPPVASTVMPLKLSMLSSTVFNY